VHQSPADLDLKYEDVWLLVGGSQSASLHGWWLKSNDAAHPAFLYLHGNDMNIGSNVERIARLNRMGFAVLAVDYRGYGKSGGDFPSEIQVYEDAEAAWNYLVQERHVDPKRVFIYGHSLGGAIAIELALRHPDAAGLVVESTFTSMPAMAKTVYWMFPADWLLNQRFDALAKVPMLRVFYQILWSRYGGRTDCVLPRRSVPRSVTADASVRSWRERVSQNGPTPAVQRSR
jgi:pimeloyl-ACP methyl ester carboxylesterase